MILIGMFDSPFVRRVAVSMNLLAIPFEHRDWSIGKDFDRIRQFNPLGRVPTLVLSEETLIESGAILDFLDQTVGAERGLLPAGGLHRREALRIMAIAIGAAEKGVLQIYETAFRPPEKRHSPWVDRCRLQMSAALAELDSVCKTRGANWLICDQITQADITMSCVYTFLSEALALNDASLAFPNLHAAASRCEAMPEFRSVKADWFAPSDP
jgi:glutathione S-transferase